MGDCKRLTNEILKIFPSLTPKVVMKDIAGYRLSRDNNEQDWEGKRKHFRQVVKVAVSYRHR